MAALDHPPPTDVPGALSAASHRLVDALTRSVHRLRSLHHVLDEDPTDDAAARRLLGEQFAETTEALGVARSFDESISQIERSGPVTASTLLSDAAVIASMKSWVKTVEQTAELIVADLTAIDALATSFRSSAGSETDIDDTVLTLIGSLARNAIDRIDLVHPPTIA